MKNLLRLYDVCGKTVYTKNIFRRFIIPLLKEIIAHQKHGETLIVGIQGGQGTGKTTLSNYIKRCLEKLGYRVCSFSIDDFYKSYKERLVIARLYKGNPFYQIRGMPGTHRVRKLLNVLKRARRGLDLEIPIFDKSLHNAQGDVLKKTRHIKGRQDIILFEGWCLGIPTVDEKTFLHICKRNGINLKKIDPELKHFRKVLENIKSYQPLWEYIDFMIMMKPIAPELHKRWRYWQELELRKTRGEGMNKKEVYRFVELYLPFTYLCYEKIKPDIILTIDRDHNICGISINPSRTSLS